MLGARAAVAIAALVATAPLTAGAQRSTLERLLRDTVLANGLHVIVLPNPTIPVATIEVVVRNGAFTQLDPADEGVPHLLEHMLFKSFGAGDNDGFASRAARLNAAYNGTTSEESVTYYLTLPSRNVARGMGLMADLMRAPRFRRSELEEEQRVVKGELERNVADPAFLLSVSVGRLLWGPAFGRKHVIGNVLSIMQADPGRLRRNWDRYYVPNNAALIVTGDVAPDAVFAEATEHFGGWKRGPDPFEAVPIPPIPPLERDTLTVLVEGTASDVTVMLRWQGPSVRQDPDATYAADVFSTLVNQPHSGLQRRLVETGLFQSAWMSYYTLDHVGPITLVARTSPERIRTALAALRSELSRFDDPDYFTDEEMRIAQRRLQVDAALELESAGMLAHTIGFWWSVAGLDYYLGYTDELGAQTPDALRGYVQRYVLRRPKVIGMLISDETRVAHGQDIALGLSEWFW